MTKETANQCLHCNTVLMTRASKKFCSRECSNIFSSNVRREKGLIGAPQTCSICKKTKPIMQFSYQIRGNRSSGRKHYCKRCGANMIETKRRNRTWKDDALKVLLSNARQRAKRAGLDFNITRADIIIPDICPVFGFPLKREPRDSWMWAPSIDRIDNTKGYVKGNVIIVSRRANILKKDASITELQKLANFYANLS